MKRRPILLTWTKRKFQCVYSDELLQNKGPQPEEKEETLSQITKGQTNGSLAHITAIFGFTLAGLVLQDAANSTIGDRPGVFV